MNAFRKAVGPCGALLLVALTFAAAPGAASGWDPNRVPKGYEPAPGGADRPDYQMSWRPARLFVSSASVLLPISDTTLGGIPRQGERLTGLSAFPCSPGVVCAVTAPDWSGLIRLYPEDGAQKLVVSADQLGHDLWLHDPLSVSPNARWALASVSGGRQGQAPAGAPDAPSWGAAGDLWVFDLTASSAARCVATDVTDMRCVWSPSGSRAACLVSRGEAETPSTLILDAEHGTAEALSAHWVWAVWSLDSASVRLIGPHSVAEYDLATGHVERREPASAPTAGLDGRSSLVSPDGRLVAWTDSEAERPLLRIAHSSGRVRAVETPESVARLLAWSCLSEVVAFLGSSGGLYFVVAAPAVGEYNRLLSAFPAMEGFPSVRDGYGFHTVESPVRVATTEDVVGAWVETPDGPALVLVSTSEGQQAVRMIGFRRLSLPELGFHPQRTGDAEIADKAVRVNLREVYEALKRYAREHDGTLPNAATGEALRTELADYVFYPGALTTPDAPGEVRVTLLHPGGDLQALLEQAAAHRRERALHYDEQGPIETKEQFLELRRGEEGFPLLRMDCPDGAAYFLVLTSFGADIRVSEGRP